MITLRYTVREKIDTPVPNIFHFNFLLCMHEGVTLSTREATL